MTESIIDLTFGIDNKSIAIASMIKHYYIMEYDREYHTSLTPMYNGRERWLCLAIRHFRTNESIFIRFGENRNSDHICVDIHNENEKILVNPPTVDVFTESDYQNRKFFDYEKIFEVGDFIVSTVEQFKSKHDEKDDIA